MTDISRPRKAEPFENEPFTHDLVALLRECVDPAWYLETYPDVAAAGLDAVEHFTRFGARERRDPNRWFNSEWYAAVHSEVKAGRLDPITHYLMHGASRLLDPHICFDAARYVAEHPEAAENPLLFHLRTGHAAGFSTGTRPQLSAYFDADWYIARYPDVPQDGVDPFRHYIRHGSNEDRFPNPWFDPSWYRKRYAIADLSGLALLTHFIRVGEPALFDPHPRFDSAWYVEQHTQARDRPLLHHLSEGAAIGRATRPSTGISRYLPSREKPLAAPSGTQVDIVIPVYRGIEQTRRCINAVLDDPEPFHQDVIVIDDCSPERPLSAWLDELARAGRIKLLRNKINLGFVASVNRGLGAAGARDVVLLNSDTETPAGWLGRLAAHADTHRRVASVSPFSNNATICGYPSDDKNPMALGLSLGEMDAIARETNRARNVDIPTSVGFCMYLRRDAIEAVGLFDEETFGKGYGEENDFCFRATRLGWRHLLACDVFVFHEGSVSFGEERKRRTEEATRLLVERHPDYLRAIARYIERDEVGPFRFSITAAAFRKSALPTILLVVHDLGGGVEQHVQSKIVSLGARAHFLVLRPHPVGVALSIPAFHDKAVLEIPADDVDDLAILLRSAAVCRVHIHHLANMKLDVRGLIDRLDVPYDLTVHDFYAICPQVTMLPTPEGVYCGEPGPAICNGCIAARPSHGATDINTWRLRQAWPYRGAERVICPSQSVRDRIARFGLADRAIIRPHEPEEAGFWRLEPPPLDSGKIRIAIIGVLANHKGAHAVAAVLAAANPDMIEIKLIGHAMDGFPRELRPLLRETGKYMGQDLPRLLGEYRPHIAWFPMPAPETYSYTLTAAMNAGLPIVATDIGVLPERLAGRPMSWLAPPNATPEQWLAIFDEVGAALRSRETPPPATRSAVPDFHLTDYLSFAGDGEAPTRRTKGALTDLRGHGRIGVVIIPEHLDEDILSPCAYIRLIQPFDHPSIGREMNIVLADGKTALNYVADIFVTQRFAIANVGEADALADHVNALGAALVYDLDDNLLEIPEDHQEAVALRPKASVVRRMLRNAHAIWVSTPSLAASLPPTRGRVTIIENGIDERLWFGGGRADRHDFDPVRILYMGTATHGAGLNMILEALQRIVRDFPDRVEIDIVGVTQGSRLPEWIRRQKISVTAARSYPAFVHWIKKQPPWDIGLAPLPDTHFNKSKSAIKALDYAALRLAVLASDTSTYRDALSNGDGGRLVTNTTEAWYAAISALVRDAPLRRSMADRAYETLMARGTLASQAEQRRQAIFAIVPDRAPAGAETDRRH